MLKTTGRRRRGLLCRPDHSGNHPSGDCIETSRQAIESAKVDSVDQVYHADRPLIGLSAQLDQELKSLEEFLMQRFYLHPRLLEAADQAHAHLAKLFAALCKDPKRMPGYFQRFIPQFGLHRAVVDYIAGMTDRYCLRTLESL